jgi:hypothetical protein
VTVAWTAATDAEGDDVSYRWEAIITGGSFSTPLLSVDTDATSFETTLGELDATLEAAGVTAGESAVLEHRVVAFDGEATTAGPVAMVTLTRGVFTNAEATPLPTVFAALGAYPNPSVGTPRIAVDLPWSAEIRVEIYDMAGRHVVEKEARLGAGRGQTISLDGLRLSTGVYLYRLVAAAPSGPETAAGRLTIVR